MTNLTPVVLIFVRNASSLSTAFSYIKTSVPLSISAVSPSSVSVGMPARPGESRPQNRRHSFPSLAFAAGEPLKNVAVAIARAARRKLAASAVYA